MAQLAAIDVETTGISPYHHHRIVEVAAVKVAPNGEKLGEFVTLVNPDRDIGPTRVHGIRARDVAKAPRFSEILGDLCRFLDGCSAIVGHNVRFDHSFLTAEFKKAGCRLPDVPTYCTMSLCGGGKLEQCCQDFGIEMEGECHSALVDAWAAARLFCAVAADSPSLVRELESIPRKSWPILPPCDALLLRREQAKPPRDDTHSFLGRVVDRAISSHPFESEDPAILAYAALLDRALEDRVFDELERRTLSELAANWGIDSGKIAGVHWDYLMRLAISSLADGNVSDLEERDLGFVSDLLGLESSALSAALNQAQQILNSAKVENRSTPPEVVQSLKGLRICFTGESDYLLQGTRPTREASEELAIRSGLIVVQSVTKKLDFLVAADPYTQSGKAKKARQYGIPIIGEEEFWNRIGLGGNS